MDFVGKAKRELGGCYELWNSGLEVYYSIY